MAMIKRLPNNDIAKRIDDACKAFGGTPKHPPKVRGHLGASEVGKKCIRALWYSFRWATPKQFEGRMYRLFDRGHEEENRFIEFLRMIGIEVTNADISGKQYSFKAVFGHFSGSVDGFAIKVPGAEAFGLTERDLVLLEFKTHSEKSFTKLVAAHDDYLAGIIDDNPLKRVKPEHYAQMCTYMRAYNLKLGLYVAVNKNTDELFVFFVQADDVEADKMLGKAYAVINSRKPPERISNSAAWFECKFCDHAPTCHFGAPMQLGCRTCIHSRPIEDGQWQCEKFNCNLTLEMQQSGCTTHERIA